MLTGAADEQVLDKAFRPHGHDGCEALVVLERADSTHRPYDGSHLDVFGTNATALDFVEADANGFSVVLLLTLVDGDVIHPHPILLRRRRGVREAHGIAVVENLPRARGLRGGCLGFAARTECRLLVLVDGEIIAAVLVFLRRCRPIGSAAGVAVVENGTIGR